MFTLERQNEIIEIMQKQKAISVRELSAIFFTSESSIRRDLTALEKRGFIKRTYGGAVLLEGNNIEIPANVRNFEQKDTKNKIARIAAGLVQNQDTIFLDASTTTKQMIGFLNTKSNLTVVTNGIQTIAELATLDNISVYAIGGKLRNHSLSIVGSQAESFVKNFWASKLFFSCTGLSETLGAMDYSDAEAEVRKKIMENCETKVLLIDHTKFECSAFYKICSFDEIDILITDRKPSEHWLNLLQKCGVQVLYPEENSN